jgi:drug/metabolite transporter (DMT)-like permease
MNTVNRGLPASITSMALLAVPIMGLICSALILNESISFALWLATGLIIGGIALATSARKR